MKCLKVKGYGWRTLCFGLGRIWEAFKRKDWIIDEWENVQLHEMKPSHTLSLLFYIYIYQYVLQTYSLYKSGKIAFLICYHKLINSKGPSCVNRSVPVNPDISINAFKIRLKIDLEGSIYLKNVKILISSKVSWK